MRLAERFDARSVTWFLRVFGLALVADVAIELAAGIWHVHAGRLYPWRHLGILPLYRPGVLALEWAIRAGAGLGLLLAPRRGRAVAASVRVAALGLFVAVLERFSNHGVLLFLVALFLSLAPPDVAAPAFEAEAHPALGLVRAQLVIVYAFSALNKLTHGFGRGDSLANLLALPLGPARALSWAVIVTELALPLVLLRRPRLGVLLVLALHGAMAALLPNTASFGVAMLAVALLFLSRPPRPTDPEPAAPSPSPAAREDDGARAPPPRT